MKMRWHLFLATLVAGVLAAANASAALLVNDTWQDGTRTDPASPVYSENGTDGDADGLESAWYTSNAGGMSATPGHLVQSTATGSTSWQTYFTPEATPVTLANTGDSAEIRWVFSMQGVVNNPGNVPVDNTGQNFRLAVVDSSAAARVSSDLAPGAGDYPGYAMFMNIDQTLRRSTPFELKERSTVNGAFLSASAVWGTSLGDDGTTNDPGYASGTTYTYTMTLTRNASSGLDIVSRMAGAGLGPGGVGFLQVATTDATPSSFTFDMFGLRPSGAATSAAAFDTTLFQVTFTPGVVPEPASAALAGLGGLVALAFRRRR